MLKTAPYGRGSESARDILSRDHRERYAGICQLLGSFLQVGLERPIVGHRLCRTDTQVLLSGLQLIVF